MTRRQRLPLYGGVIFLALLAILRGPYAVGPLFADADWYATALPALTSDAPLYDPAKLLPHPLERPVFWDQAPSTALFASILLLPAGAWLWGGLMAASVVVGLAILWPRLTPTGTVLLAAVLVAWMPITGALIRGNINALVFLCLAVALRWPRWAGIAVGIATAAKLVPVLMVAWLIGKRDWRGAGAAVAIPAVMTAIMLAWKGPETLADFVALRLNQSGAVGGAYHYEVGLPAPVGYGLALVIAALAAWRASFSLAVVAILISIPVLHLHYWTWLLIPFVGIWMPWLLRRVKRNGQYAAPSSAPPSARTKLSVRSQSDHHAS